MVAPKFGKEISSCATAGAIIGFFSAGAGASKTRAGADAVPLIPACVDTELLNGGGAAGIVPTLGLNGLSAVAGATFAGAAELEVAASRFLRKSPRATRSVPFACS